MIFMGSSITAEYLLVRYDLKGCCVGASFNINLVFLYAIGKLFRYRTIHFWMGTDVLQLNKVWHWRLRFWLFNFFIDKHYAQSKWLAEELQPFFEKPIEVLTIKPTWMEYEDTLLFTKRKP